MLKQHLPSPIFMTLLLAVLSQGVLAAVLPEDRADLLYHSYDGGGVTVTGPSVLVRKGFKDTVSVYANYYVDQVTSASIDVLTSGSEYSEDRVESSLGVDYLYDKTTMTVNLTNSSENDYEADTVFFGIAQDFFGDLTTLSLGYSQGDDLVMQNGNPNFQEEKTTRRFKLGLSQILTRRWTLALNIESVIDQGYLNNPYRQTRSFDRASASPGGRIPTAGQGESYPTTRNSDAFALTSMYYLPYRAAIRTEARVFSDSWGIEANNVELAYIHPINSYWVAELKLRRYTQDQADFYADVFDFLDPLIDDPDRREQRARDKELSTYNSLNIGVGVSYDTEKEYLPFIEKTSVKLQWDTMRFDYDNFRNALLSQGADAQFNPGEEPLYRFTAGVLRLNIAIFY